MDHLIPDLIAAAVGLGALAVAATRKPTVHFHAPEVPAPAVSPAPLPVTADHIHLYAPVSFSLVADRRIVTKQCACGDTIQEAQAPWPAVQE